MCYGHSETAEQLHRPTILEVLTLLEIDKRQQSPLYKPVNLHSLGASSSVIAGSVHYGLGGFTQCMTLLYENFCVVNNHMLAFLTLSQGTLAESGFTKMSHHI